MNAKTHATILKAMIAVAVIGGFIFFLFLCASARNNTLGAYCASFAFFLVLWLMVLFLVPVRCHRPGCQGRMDRNWIEAPGYQLRLQYGCDTCGEKYDTNITIGLGEPW